MARTEWGPGELEEYREQLRRARAARGIREDGQGPAYQKPISLLFGSVPANREGLKRLFKKLLWQARRQDGAGPRPGTGRM